MVNFWKIVNDVIKYSDVLLLVADARTPKESINNEILDKMRKLKKKYIVVFNKCDLLREEERNYYDPAIPYVMYVSATEHLNTQKLYRKIREISHGKVATVGILGYPNTGKSSLINAMKGKKSAGTSAQAGFTRGIQKIRVSGDILLLDTPGVIPYKEKDIVKHALIAARDPNKVRDPETAAFEIMAKFPEAFEKHYGIEIGDDPEAALELLAEKQNLYQKGKKPDTYRAAMKLLHDWQRGIFRR